MKVYINDRAVFGPEQDSSIALVRSLGVKLGRSILRVLLRSLAILGSSETL